VGARPRGGGAADERSDNKYRRRGSFAPVPGPAPIDPGPTFGITQDGGESIARCLAGGDLAGALRRWDGSGDGAGSPPAPAPGLDVVY